MFEKHEINRDDDYSKLRDQSIIKEANARSKSDENIWQGI